MSACNRIRRGTLLAFFFSQTLWTHDKTNQNIVKIQAHDQWTVLISCWQVWYRQSRIGFSRFGGVLGVRLSTGPRYRLLITRQKVPVLEGREGCYRVQLKDSWGWFQFSFRQLRKSVSSNSLPHKPNGRTQDQFPDFFTAETEANMQESFCPRSQPGRAGIRLWVQSTRSSVFCTGRFGDGTYLIHSLRDINTLIHHLLAIQYLATMPY